MNGVRARARDNFNEPILKLLEQPCEEFGRLTGRQYGLLQQPYKCEDADAVFVSLGCRCWKNIEAGVRLSARSTQCEELGQFTSMSFARFPKRRSSTRCAATKM